MKKLVALCLACMLALLCAGGLAEVSKDGLPVSEEKITLTGLVSSDTKVGDWNENPTVKLFEERTNIQSAICSLPAMSCPTSSCAPAFPPAWRPSMPPTASCWRWMSCWIMPRICAP